MDEEYTIYGVKVVQPWDEEGDADYWIPPLYEEIKKGRARLGYGWYDGADLRQIKVKIEKKGWDALSKNEKCTWGHTGFIFDYEVKVGDYFVYINMPDYDKCSVVRIVEGPEGIYTFTNIWDKNKENNFRHAVSCEFIGTFDRNSLIVHPYLRRRLGQPRAWYRIFAKKEFEELLVSLETGVKGKSDKERLEEHIDKHLVEIVKEVNRNFPGKKLEDLLLEVYRKVPNVKEVRKGPDINGADLEIEFETGLSDGGLQNIEFCAVQVKSYEGKMWFTEAIDDLKRAFASNPKYTCGLIVSTALEMTEEFEEKMDALRKEKNVDILLGKDLAYFLTKYGID